MATNKISIRLFHGSIHLLIPPTRPSAVLVTSKHYSQCIYAHILNILNTIVPMIDTSSGFNRYTVTRQSIGEFH
ncbi:hypothetical protein C8R48DRAFT_721882 [Suillus tomentosus]|nr:hypothetical protein C8R48DRAFT_721882 [Suillus tomentosus]